MNRTNYLYQKLASIAPTVAQLATVAGSADRWRRKRIVAKCLIAAVAAIMGSSPAMANTMDFKDWTASFGSGKETWTNTSSAGTVTGTSMCPGCWGAPTGTFGVANAIDPPGPITFTTEFNASPNPSSVNFVFSNNYDWGTGGELILGNIHDYFEYSLQAWDFGGNPIDVNTQWTFLNEYLNGAAGQQGYFSTSSTNRCAGGSSLICAGPSTAEDFYVYDTMVDANSGQGGLWYSAVCKTLEESSCRSCLVVLPRMDRVRTSFSSTWEHLYRPRNPQARHSSEGPERYSYCCAYAGHVA